MKRVMTAFKQHILYNMPAWLLAGLALCLTQGRMLFRDSIGIDTEGMLNDPELYYEPWNNVGRHGLVLLSRLLNPSGLQVLRAGIVSALFLILACILWTFLFSQENVFPGKDPAGEAREARPSVRTAVIANTVFSVLLVISPIFTEQLYFKLQAQEICLSLCLAAVSVFLAWRFAFPAGAPAAGFTAKRCLSGVCASVLLAFLISVYQAFMVLFVFGVCALFVLACVSPGQPQRRQQDTAAFPDLRVIWLLIAVFFAGCVLNLLSTVLAGGQVFGSGDMNWGVLPFSECLLGILRQLYIIGLSRLPFYTHAFSPMILLTFIALLRRRKRIRGEQETCGTFRMVLTLTGYFLLLLSPFLILFLTGGPLPVRAMFPLSFLTAFLARLCVLFTAEDLACANILCSVLSALLILYGIAECTRFTILYTYTDTLRYQQDVAFAEAFWARVEPLQDTAHSKPVLCYGGHEAPLDERAIRGDVIGSSFFAWDVDVAPTGYYNSARVMRFCHTLGIDFPRPNLETAQKFLPLASGMPVWPAEGSVTEAEGVIIVNFGISE